MNEAYEIAGVGLASQQRALDVIANNIANMNTPAFKRVEMRFSELMSRAGDPQNPSATLENGGGVAGVQAHVSNILSEQGDIQRTGGALDLAIDGDGFIELLGPGGQSMLWRGGALVVQSDGQLGAGDGLKLGSMITIPRDAVSLEIRPDGVVAARTADSDIAVELGEIALVRVDNPSSVERLDGGLYRVIGDAPLTDAKPGEDGAGSLIQGAIEGSNVRLNDEMVRLMIVQRAYAANAQIVQAADQLAGIANNLRK